MIIAAESRLSPDFQLPEKQPLFSPDAGLPPDSETYQIYIISPALHGNLIHWEEHICKLL